ncbi:hypothetical protein GUJ93_ZPchr0011g27206 [Zizania palustris]|uniref:Uncharacterized protein n=1 Tax=Zizania palustris TaxID=103762 RepID=A0A8J5WEH2_ZIZPA|nr:hypothetical protein GUJ93_ZPchr0011g27206 [Zizania palustris]
MAEAVVLAVSKIGTTLTEEATKVVMAKLSEKVTNLKELPRNVTRIEKDLNMMNNVIQDLGTLDIRKNAIRGWVAEVRKLAYNVENIMDKYLYYAHQMHEEGKVMKVLNRPKYIKIFSDVADEVVQIEKDIKHVKDLKEWSLTVEQMNPNKVADFERQGSTSYLPELTKDEDLVGIEDNRRKLTQWLYTSEPHSTVITVSGMGGLGKTTLNLQESRIVITTRKEDVASLASSKCRLELQPLGDTDSFNLFCRRAFNNIEDCRCPSELKEVATSIVRRCQGLPLAIVSMGSLMSSRKETVYVWNRTYSQLKDEMLKNDNVRAILNLSYHDMPGDLRNCVLYCSMFPEDYPMSRESLVRLWVAEGFAVTKDGNNPEDVAEGNLMELIHRNMLVIDESDELGRVSTCRMHDIMRELVLSVAKEEMFGSASDNGTMINMDTGVRRFSTYKWKDDRAPTMTFQLLRTLMSLEAVSSSTDMLNSFFLGSNYLTVLELQDSAINEVPVSIGNLFNLRYIGLRRTKVHKLPECIEKLSNLQTLDMKQTQIVKLPRGIARIKKLRHLIADKYVDERQSTFRYFVGVQAPKGLSGLEELQTLETVGATTELAEQLDKLMKLQSVWIDNISAAHCTKLFTALSNMQFLSSLLLSACDEKEELCFQNLKPISKLHKLIIRGQWATGTLKCPIFQDHGKNLRYLALSWCQLGEDPLGVLAPHVPNLTYLKLNNMSSVKNLILCAGSFPKLKTIVLNHMPDVNQLDIMDGALPVIEGMYIMSLTGLDRIPQGIESLHSLKKLWLVNLHKNFKDHWINNEMHQKMQHVPNLRV